MIRVSVEIGSRRIAEIVIANIGGDADTASYAWSVREAPGLQGTPGLDRRGVLHGHDRRQPVLALVSRVLSEALGTGDPENKQQGEGEVDAGTAAALESAHRPLVAAVPLTPAQEVRWAMLEVAERGS